ncbi:hypothetical protein [Iodidimonas gelatinilytica]|nr:hypothetical protein [Iodidimonas gelatinilytica]
MNAKLDFQPPPQEKTTAPMQTAGPAASFGRRLWPFAFAAVLSTLWVMAAGYAAMRAGLFNPDNPLQLVDLAALIAGVLTPLAIVWLIALVFQRTDPLLERRLEIAQDMDRALAPIEHAEKRLDQLLVRVRHDMDHVEAAVDLAASRIDSLEGRFKSEIADLFSVTADAEAKAASIQDMFRREREALGQLDEQVTQRLRQSEETADSFSERVIKAAGAAGDAVDKASGTLDDRGQSLIASAEQAAADLKEAEAALGDRLTALDDLSRLLDARFNGMSHDISTQLDRFKQRMAELDQLDGQLTQTLEERHSRLAYLAESSESDAQRVTQALEKSSDLLNDRAQEALNRSEDAGREIERQAQELDRIIGSTLERAQESFRGLSENLALQAHEADTISKQQADEALDRVKAALSGFEAQLAAFDDKANEAGMRIAERISHLKSNFDDEAGAVEHRAARSVEELNRLAAMLADQAEMVASAAGDAAQNMGEAGERMDERTANLGQVLEDMRQRIDEVTARLEEERGALAATSEASANTVLEAADRFRTQSDDLSRHAEATSERVLASSENLSTEIARIDQQGRGATQALEQSLQSLKAEGSGLMETLERSSESLGQAATAFGGERERILNDTADAAKNLHEAAEKVGQKAEQMRTAGGETGDHLNAIASRFSGAAEKIMEAARAAETSAKTSGQEFEQTLSVAITRGLREVGQSMDTLNTMFDAEVRDLENHITQTINKTVNALREASAQAGDESERMAHRLAEQSDKLIHKANSFLSKSEEVERRILASSRDEFVRTSSLLIESLQSASVDIDKILEAEVPDDVWQKYLSGDRSIFSRRTVRLADRTTRQRIIRMFETDREFRDTVLKFFRDFEALMEQVGSRDKHSALSVTLISSEMGKLYVLLAQSLKKIQ